MYLTKLQKGLLVIILEKKCDKLTTGIITVERAGRNAEADELREVWKELQEIITQCKKNIPRITPKK